jgi:zinc and cadmium transporter
VLHWIAALGFSALGSIGGLIVSSVVLFVGKDLRARIVPWLVSYAVGTMLGAALLGLLPEALDELPARAAATALLGGVLTFFVIEKLVLWHHWHGDDTCDVHKSTATLLIVGESLHTFVDGVAIAAAVLVSTPLGLTTTLAIVAHEIPQEAGDFAILLAAGYTRRRAIVLNLAAASGGVIGAAAMRLFGEHVPAAVPYVLAFAAGNFLYVAMADLIPSLHRGHLDRNSMGQAVLMGLGVLTIAALSH